MRCPRRSEDVRSGRAQADAGAAARLKSVTFSDFVSADGAVIAATDAQVWRLGYETVAETKAGFRAVGRPRPDQRVGLAGRFGKEPCFVHWDVL